MVLSNPILSSPKDSYHGYRNPKTKTVTVFYDDKNIRDEEMIYEFKPDGSASSVSCAWGVKTELPPGTFSDLLLTLPETEVLKNELAQDLANAYRDNIKKNNK